VIIISDFDGADQQTRRLVAALAQHNDVIVLLPFPRPALLGPMRLGR
jgi:hypothetical protein